jgi:glycosyltransferase involved in cell wall biosynthesis
MYEGFGLPPLEAMSLGCPVICSNVSSLPEVVGNAAEQFAPQDIDSIQTAIEDVVFNTEHRKNLISLGYMQSKLFSWEKCATETLYVYKKISCR